MEEGRLKKLSLRGAKRRSNLLKITDCFALRARNDTFDRPLREVHLDDEAIHTLWTDCFFPTWRIKAQGLKLKAKSE